MDMSGDHAIALMGVLFLPVGVLVALFVLQMSAARSPAAARVWWRICAANPATRVASVLLLATADIHLTLVPAHLVEQPITGILFLVDGVALVAGALAAFATPRWRAPALALLLANLLAYALYLDAGWEGADIIGIATKLVEAGAIVAILASSRMGMTASPYATVDARVS
jgi:hypothetical protein